MNSETIMNREDEENEVWRELDKFAFLGSILAIILLIATYFIVAGWESLPKTPKDFLLAVITNLIPGFLLVVFAYILFRKLQHLRARRDRRSLVEELMSPINSKLDEYSVSNKAELEAVQALLRDMKSSVEKLQLSQAAYMGLFDRVLEGLLHRPDMVGSAEKTGVGRSPRLPRPKNASRTGRTVAALEEDADE